MAREVIKVKCALTGAEFGAGEGASHVTVRLDKDTKVELRVLKRIGSNAFAQTPLCKPAAARLHDAMEALLAQKAEEPA